MKTCRNGLHEMTVANTAHFTDPKGRRRPRCRECQNARVRRQRTPAGAHLPRPSAATAEDFVFLFETGLSPRAIAAKLSMHYPSMLVAIRRAGVRIEYDFRAQTWRMP